MPTDTSETGREQHENSMYREDSISTISVHETLQKQYKLKPLCKNILHVFWIIYTSCECKKAILGILANSTVC